MSYIIKNCPCYDYDYEECLNTPRDVYKNCYDISDCLLKKIADKCKEHPFIDCACGDDILQLFDIEEV